MNKEVHSFGPYPGTSDLASITAPQLPALKSWQALSNASDLFLKSLTFGRVRGVANLYLSPDDTPGQNAGYVRLICELIKRDILVTITCPKKKDFHPIIS